jgi:hypothetical protein
MMESRLTPRPDEYANSGYKATAEGISPFYDEHDIRVPVTLLKGERPKLVMTSTDYQISLKASGQSERVLSIGPCIIVPIPIIPVLILSHSSSENLIVLVRIDALNGHRFKLGDMTVKVKTNSSGAVKTFTYSENIPLKHVHEAIASFPVPSSSVDNIEVGLRIIEEGAGEIIVPPMHLYSSTGITSTGCVWLQ